MEKLAEQLYAALTDLLIETHTGGLLAAAGDAKMKVPFGNASPKTRIIFMSLAANLTKAQGQ